MAYTLADLDVAFNSDPESKAAWNRASPEQKQAMLDSYNNGTNYDLSVPPPTVGSSPAAGVIPTALAGKQLYDTFTANKLAEAAPNVMTSGGNNAAMGLTNSDGSPVGGAGISTYIPGVVGLASLADLYANDRTGARAGLQGGLGGGGLGYTAAELIAPGSGLLGAGIGGVLGLGAGLLNKKSTKEIQADRWKAAGVADPNPGRDYFAGTGGEQSRDESFLTPDAIRSNPDNYNNVPNWDSWSKEKQDKFLSTLLAEKKVTERKGGIYYDDARAQQLAAEIGAQPDTAPASSGPRRDDRRREKDDKNPFKTPYQPGVTIADLLPTVDIPKPVGDPGNAIPSYTPKTFAELYDEQVKKRRGTYGQL